MKNPKYIVEGFVRGRISEHRVLNAAVKSMVKDQKSCSSLGGGVYSDAMVFENTIKGLKHIPILVHFDGTWMVDDFPPEY